MSDWLVLMPRLLPMIADSLTEVCAELMLMLKTLVEIALELLSTRLAFTLIDELKVSTTLELVLMLRILV